MGRSKDLATGETRFVNTAGDTMTGNLAINNASGSQVTLHRTDTTIANDDLYGQIILSGDDADTNSSGTRGYIRGRSQGSGGGLKMEFGTAAGGVAMGDPRMTINADGYVTKPNQPAFQADGNFGWRNYSSYTVVPDWRTTQSGWFNQGGHFNHNTGVFTCPIAGKYMIQLSIWVNNSGTTLHIGRVGRNGAYWGDNLMGYQNADTGYPDNNISASYIMNASANDTITYYHQGDIYGYHSNWSIYLLG
tara:strand:- start:55 stop:798 length:744 start_codon:yes stop_codon:yes gene_type:complete